MRDLALLTLLLVACGYTLARPWIGVLMLAVISFMSPQMYTYGFMRTSPIYFVAFCVAAMAFLFARERRALPADWRVPAFYLLWAWYLVTTLHAVVPDYAWIKLVEVSKIYLPLLFTLVLITNRERLLALLVTIGVSIGLIATKGGLFAVAKGFSHRVWGPDGTMYGGNNEFAIATLMAIPLLLLWQRETTSRWVRIALMGAVPLCFASALCSWSRGALLTMGALVTILLLHSQRKWLAAPLVGLGAVLAMGALPEEWFGRMQTLETYDEDASAMGRIDTWVDGINYALANPVTGAGFDGWLMVSRRDWHSTYVEVVAEHGFVGAGLWAGLLFGSILSLTHLAALGRRNPAIAWVTHWAYMLRASLVCYGVGGIFLGISYWDLFYQLVFCAALMRTIALEELAAASPVASGIRQIPPPARRPVTPPRQPAPAHRVGRTLGLTGR
jgi:probable O-glycosylation ligase (exosortase A-associated)